MSLLDALYTLIILPLQYAFELVYLFTYAIIGNAGLSIIALSLTMNILILPLYMRADALQEQERTIEQKLKHGVDHIKKTFKGNEKTMMLQAYYRQNNYKPTDVIKGSISLFLEIPFFVAAYMFLSHLNLLQGVSFWFIPDLGAPDGLLQIQGVSLNVLPFVMTAVNLASCFLFLKGMPTKTKVQLLVMAGFFLVFLYNSPAGLVLYWTLNNVFALVKTIFYKISNPKRTLSALLAFAGIAFILLAAFAFVDLRIKVRVLIALVGFLCLIPEARHRFQGQDCSAFKEICTVFDIAPSRTRFVLLSLFLAAFIGLFIPSSVIASSPQEFIYLDDFYNPLWFVAYSALLAAGSFLVWGSVFYWLCNRRAKLAFEFILAIIALGALASYMLFGGDLGVLSSHLKFEQGMAYSLQEKLSNLGILALACVLSLAALRLWPRLSVQVVGVATCALLIISCINIYGINNSVHAIEEKIKPEHKDKTSPSFTLSTTGKNVIVIMLDRALGELVPSIMQEKPDLKKQFAGFEYFENTLSFGGFTNFGSPSLYGGYEYTPLEINKRSDEALVDKQNEALKVMPYLFDDNGFRVTVLDPTYAGYQWFPDLSIYNSRPSIKAFESMGAFNEQENAQEFIEDSKRNFFMYGLMRSLPLVCQRTLYNKGNYFNSAMRLQEEEFSTKEQSLAEDGLSATGTRGSFMSHWATLSNLDTMTHVDSDPQNTFMMMSNDLTHEPMLLQEPSYEPQPVVDNHAYADYDATRFTVDGTSLEAPDNNARIHYHANMAAFMKIGHWLDYLREKGVYDNTRIIIVSDHGSALNLLPNRFVYPGEERPDKIGNLEIFYPLLMVKDFNAHSFSTSSEFMTNADVPTLAYQGLIKNPQNPLTGKALNNDEKFEHDQIVYGSTEWNVMTNNGTTFLPGGVWYKVHTDMRKPENWTVIQDPLAGS